MTSRSDGSRRIPRRAAFIGGPIDGDVFRRVSAGFPAELIIWHGPSHHRYLAAQEGNKVVYRHQGPVKADREGRVIS